VPGIVAGSRIRFWAAVSTVINIWKREEGGQFIDLLIITHQQMHCYIYIIYIKNQRDATWQYVY
jgi:hypothetical protein